KEFGIGKSTVQGILVKSSKWLSINEVSIEGMQKRERPIKWQSLEDALWLWVVKHGEAASAPNQELVDEERLSIQEELARWKLDDIFNADETGLFWAMEPPRTLSDRKLSGHKANKSRVAVLLITNVNEYIPIDDYSLTDDAWDDEEIIARAIGLQCDAKDESSVKEDKISFKEGETILNRALLFLEQQGDSFS
ncbi:4235_t:CDS:2, partial [Paraglomus brasilianum]